MSRLYCLALSSILLSILIIGVAHADELKATLAQSFYVNGTWVSASDMKAGDIVQTSDGRTIRITNVTDVIAERDVHVYGLQTSSTHTYLVDGGIIARDTAPPREANSTQTVSERSWLARPFMFFQKHLSAWVRGLSG